jgi:hypothetical protein
LSLSYRLLTRGGLEKPRGLAFLALRLARATRRATALLIPLARAAPRAGTRQPRPPREPLCPADRARDVIANRLSNNRHEPSLTPTWKNASGERRVGHLF